MNAVAMVRHSGYHQWAAEFTHPCEYCNARRTVGADSQSIESLPDHRVPTQHDPNPPPYVPRSLLRQAFN